MENVFKRASWLELFYDVAFVALIAQLTYLAASNHQTVTDYLHMFIVGYSIFVAWWSTTANRNLQPSESTADKLFVQLTMVAVFVMSLTMPAVFAGEYVGYFLALAGVRVLQTFLIGRMYYLHPQTRPTTYNLLQGVLIAAGLWVVSAFTLDPYHLVFALAALSIDILIPLTRGKGNTRRYLNVYHLHERLGLFLILVIGESMIVVALSNTATSLGIQQLVTVFSGLGMMVALWWLYYEHNDRLADVRPNNLFVFLHAHGILFLSIIGVSVGYRLQLSGGTDVAILWFSLGGAIGIAIAILLIRITLHNVCMRALWLTTGLVLLAVATVGGAVFISNVLVMSGLTLVFAMVAILDRFDAFTSKNEPRERINPHNQNSLVHNIPNEQR
jgi:low temperature requirement protein LtrA